MPVYLFLVAEKVQSHNLLEALLNAAKEGKVEQITNVVSEM